MNKEKLIYWANKYDQEEDLYNTGAECPEVTRPHILHTMICENIIRRPMQEIVDAGSLV